MKKLIYCPYDNRGFETLTEFWRHVTKKHATVLTAEEDRLTIAALDKAHATRKGKDRVRASAA